MVELTHNKHRYMVDGGNWFRRLEVGEVIPHEAQFAQYLGMECEITEVYEDGSGYMTSLDGWSFAPWCLDAVTEQQKESDR